MLGTLTVRWATSNKEVRQLTLSFSVAALLYTVLEELEKERKSLDQFYLSGNYLNMARFAGKSRLIV